MTSNNPTDEAAPGSLPKDLKSLSKPKLVELIATLQLENSTLRKVNEHLVNTMDSMNQR